MFIDNLFVNTKLFYQLRQLRISACGTAQSNVVSPLFSRSKEIEATIGDSLVIDLVYKGKRQYNTRHSWCFNFVVAVRRMVTALVQLLVTGCGP
jgi:hypothetical protein